MIAPIGSFIDGTIIKITYPKDNANCRFGIIVSCVAQHTEVVLLQEERGASTNIVPITDNKLTDLPKKNYFVDCKVVFKVPNGRYIERVGTLTRSDWVNCIREYDLLLMNHQLEIITLN